MKVNVGDIEEEPWLAGYTMPYFCRVDEVQSILKVDLLGTFHRDQHTVLVTCKTE